MADIRKQTNLPEKFVERTQRWPNVGTRGEVSMWPFGRSYEDYSASPIGLLRSMSDEMDRMISSLRPQFAETNWQDGRRQSKCSNGMGN